MRALTVEELGFVSGGNVNGLMFTHQGWQQLSASGGVELVIVTASRIFSANDPMDDSNPNRGATSFSQTSYGRMTNWFGSLSGEQRGAVIGGALVMIGGGLALAAALTPVGTLVFGVMAISTVNWAAFGLVTVGGATAIAGLLMDDPEISDKLRGLL